MMDRRLLALSLVVAVGLGACKKKEEAPPPPPPAAQAPAGMPPHGMPGQPGMPPAGMPGMPPAGMPGQPAVAPAPRQVVVPDDVKKTWKSVTLQLTDKQANKSKDVKVDIGGTAKVEGLEIKVESFLPAFSMTGGAITSKSNETANPAAKIVVKENGNQIYSGWLFSMYPDTHPMQHAKFKLILKDFAKK